MRFPINFSNVVHCCRSMTSPNTFDQTNSQILENVDASDEENRQHKRRSPVPIDVIPEKRNCLAACTNYQVDCIDLSELD